MCPSFHSILAFTGDAHLDGEDFDNHLIEYFVEYVCILCL